MELSLLQSIWKDKFSAGARHLGYLPAMGIMDESGINSRKAGTSFLDDGRNFGLIS